MDKIYNNLYKKISEYLNLDQIYKDTDYLFRKKNSSNKKLTIRINEQKNKYFTLFDFIFTEQQQSKVYTEFIVRIWNNNKSEVVEYKKVDSFEYKKIYFNKDGLEVANKELQIEANQQLLYLLQDK